MSFVDDPFCMRFHGDDLKIGPRLVLRQGGDPAVAMELRFDNEGKIVPIAAIYNETNKAHYSGLSSGDLREVLGKTIEADKVGKGGGGHSIGLG